MVGAGGVEPTGVAGMAEMLTHARTCPSVRSDRRRSVRQPASSLIRAPHCLPVLPAVPRRCGVLTSVTATSPSSLTGTL